MTRPYVHHKKQYPTTYTLEYKPRTDKMWIDYPDGTADCLEGFALTYFQVLCLQYKDRAKAIEVYRRECKESFDIYMDELRAERMSGATTPDNTALIPNGNILS